METKILGKGVYDLTEAARLTGLPRARVKDWFQVRDARPGAGPVFRSDYEAINGDLAISFLDLVELFIAGQLREHGVSLPCIRRIHSHLGAEWKTRHPFSRSELRSEGKRLFACELDEHERGAVDAVQTRQKVFDTVLLPFLKRISYDQATHLARKWSIAPHVVIDPAIGFGKPIIEAAGIATIVLAAASTPTTGTLPWSRGGMTSRRNRSWPRWNSRTGSEHEVLPLRAVVSRSRTRGPAPPAGSDRPSRRNQ
jgi:hypothetical protein